jgi:N-acetylmuramoyl-L-alanine amidase
MPRKHRVREGDHIASIAEAYGFRTDDPIWKHADNAELRAKRKSPYILAPGDEVTVPGPEKKEVTAATGERHHFLLKGTPLKIAVRLLDWDGKPSAGKSCTLTVHDDKTKETTDGDGVVRKAIPRSAHQASLVVLGDESDDDGEGQVEHERVHTLAIGSLDPIDTISGVQARLLALGYWPGDPGDLDVDHLRFAIELFQRDHKLAVDGENTPKLQGDLEEAFGC